MFLNVDSITLYQILQILLREQGTNKYFTL